MNESMNEWLDKDNTIDQATLKGKQKIRSNRTIDETYMLKMQTQTQREASNCHDSV